MLLKGTIKQKLIALTVVMALILLTLSIFVVARFNTISQFYHDVTNIRMQQQQTAAIMSEYLLGVRLNMTEVSTVDRNVNNLEEFAQRGVERLEKIRKLGDSMLAGSNDIGREIPEAVGIVLHACTKGGRIEQILKKMKPEFDQFEMSCKNLVALKTKQIKLVNQIGWYDSDEECKGEIKELVLSGRKIQDQAGEGQAGFLAMKIRSQEKNLVSRADVRYIQNIEQAIAELERFGIGELDRTLKTYKAHLNRIKDKVIQEAKLRQKIKMLVRGDLLKEQKQVDSYMDELTSRASGQLMKSLKLAQEAKQQAKVVIISGAFVSIIICIGLGLIIAGSIRRPLERISATLGDGARMVVAASGQVASSSQSQAQGSSQQAASLEETAAALEEMASMAGRNSDSANVANKLMHDTRKVVQEAGDNMLTLYKAIEQITNTSDEMAKIVRTINEIAFQTNLLALNAAVEAARAGEAGAGFAVVADEVRSLALRASEAAHNTSSMIEQNIADIGQLSEVMNTTSEVFGQVQESSAQVAGIVKEIATASAEQTRGVEQINLAMNEMDSCIQKTASGAEESASAAEELNAQAESTRELVEDLVAIVGARDKGNGIGHLKKYETKKTSNNRALLADGGAAGDLIYSEGDFFRQ